MIAFRAKDEVEVQAFHRAALENGGSDKGKPGTRPYYDPTFYVCYVRDPDGNKLACVYHRHKPYFAIVQMHLIGCSGPQAIGREGGMPQNSRLHENMRGG